MMSDSDSVSLKTYEIPPPPNPPVYAGLGVGDLVETGHLEAEGVPSLALVHKVSEGKHHLQDLPHPLAVDHLQGRTQDGCTHTGAVQKVSLNRTSWFRFRCWDRAWTCPVQGAGRSTVAHTNTNEIT